MKKHLVFKMIFFMLFFVSCKSQMKNEGALLSSLDGIPDMELVTPYADINLLENTRSATVSDSDIVNWRVARFFAVVEKIEFEDRYETWKEAKVSEKPIIIYNPASNTPMYYEFRVIKEGREIGSITCFATKDASHPVAYISEMTPKVTAKVARELVTDYATHITAVNYPGKFVVSKGNIGSKSIDGVTNTTFIDGITSEKLDIDSIIIPIKTREILEISDLETLNAMGISMEEKINMLELLREEEEEEAEDLWSSVDEQSDIILSMTDDEIKAMFFSDLNEKENDISAMGMYNKTKINHTEKTLYDWDDKASWIHENGSYCSTNVLSLIVMGLGQKSGFFDDMINGEGLTEEEKEEKLKKVIPLATDRQDIRQEKINNIYDRFDAELGINHNAYSIWNARIIQRLRTALSNRTHYTLELHGTGWTRVDNHIRNYELPVVSLRIGGWFRYGTWALHYRTITGTWKGYYEYKHKLFKRKKPSTGYEYWYWMADNGTDGTRFWECAAGSYQTQTGLVKRKNNH